MEEQDLSGILTNDVVKEFAIEHEGQTYQFKLKELPWAKTNSLLSRCITQEGKRTIMDKSEFDIRYLEEALVFAPWPLAQTRIYLKRLSPKFGKKLESHIPAISGSDVDDETLKKE